MSSRGVSASLWKKLPYKEGMLVGQWQTMPVPAQDLFQSKLGYGGSSYPWAVNEAKGIHDDYNVDNFPVAKMLCDTYTVVHGVHAPNGKPLMDKILAAFHKVLPTWIRPWRTPTTRSIRAWTVSCTEQGKSERARSLRGAAARSNPCRMAEMLRRSVALLAMTADG